MKESLIKIEWRLNTNFSKNAKFTTEIFGDKEEENFILKLTGIDANARFFLSELGTDILDETGLKIIKDHIQKDRDPELELIDFLRNPDWVAPDHGECIMVINISSYQSNHPLDPVEWDTDIDCLGILGKEVTLTY